MGFGGASDGEKSATDRAKKKAETMSSADREIYERNGYTVPVATPVTPPSENIPTAEALARNKVRGRASTILSTGAGSSPSAKRTLMGI